MGEVRTSSFSKDVSFYVLWQDDHAFDTGPCCNP